MSSKTPEKNTATFYRNSEMQYRTLFESAFDGILIIEDDVILDANKRAKDMLGSRIIGQSAYMYSPKLQPDGARSEEKAREYFNRALAGTPQFFDWQFIGTDSTLFDADISLKHIEMSGIVALVMIIRDVTDQKQREKKALSEHNLAIALAAASTLGEALHQCVHTAIQVSGMDCGGIYLLDEETGDLILSYVTGVSDEFLDSATRFKADTVMTRRIMEGKGNFEGYDFFEESYRQAREREGLRAGLDIPIFHQNRAIGNYNLGSHSIEEVPLFTRKILEAIAAQTGNAIARIKAEEALRKSEEQYRSIFEKARIGISIAQHDKLKYVNPWVIEFLKCSREKILSVPFTEFVHPNDCARVLNYHRRRLNGENVPDIYVFRILGPENEVRWVALNAVLYSWEGKPASLNFLIDINDKVQMEEALQESEITYRSTLDSMGDPIHVIDTGFRIILVNRTFEDWFDRLGYDPDVIGKHLYTVVPSLSNTILDEYKEVFRTGKMLVTNEKMGLGEKEVISETRKIPVFEKGKVVRIVTIIRDITENWRLEELKREAYEQIGKNMEQFAILNDHIRNPLQAIVGYADLEGGDLAEVIFDQAQEIDKIIKRLDVGWLESQKISEFLRKH
jgi:PAS domain S-box-containing protein